MADKRPQKPHATARPAGPGGKVVPGSLASLETTLPPTPLKKLLSAEGAGVYVYSRDHALVETIQEAGGEQYPVLVVTEWEELRSVIDTGVCHIVLLDSDAFVKGLVERIRELHALEPALVVLLAAPRDAAQGYVNLLSDRSIHRLLIKPAAVGITRLLFESAVGRYLQLREDSEMQLRDRIAVARHRTPAAVPNTQWPAWLLALSLVSLLIAGLLAGGVIRIFPDGFDGSGSTAETPSVGAEPSVTAISGPRAEPIATVAAGEAATATAESAAVPSSAAGANALQAPAAGGAVADSETAAPDAGVAAAEAAATRSAEPNETAAPNTARDAGQAESGAAVSAVADRDSAQPATSNAAQSASEVDRIAAELERADAALARGDVFRPIGGSAADIYAGILAEVPGHTEAAAGLAAILESLFTEAEAALLAEDLNSTSTLLAHIDRMQPASPRLAFLRSQLDQAQSILAAAPPPAAPLLPAAPPSEFDSLLVLADARLEAGQLFEPAGDSAETYLERAAALRPDDSALVNRRRVLAAAAANNARLALGAGDIDGAATLVDAAVRYGADSETLALLEIDLTTAREQATQAELERELALGISRLRQGLVFEPAGGNALEILGGLRAAQPNLPGLAAAWNEALAATVAGAAEAVEAGDWSAAERVIAALRTQGAPAEAVSGVQSDLDFGRRQAAYLSEAAPATELIFLAGDPPEYPTAAVRREIQGWVDLEYVVGTDGRPGQIAVVAAEPADLFDQAALDAVATHRYEPFRLDGRTYARRVRLRIRFAFR